MKQIKEAQSVWERAKGVLRKEIDKASFETWVANTHGVHLDESILVVEMSNNYGREWMQEHVKKKSEEILSGILLRDIRICFVVAGEDVKRASVKVDGDEQIHLEPRYLSAYEEIVKPERVVAIPSYYLRWIPWLGVDLAWMPIGFRQVAYLKGCKHEGGDEFEASGAEIARWSGMSLSTFWRKVKDPYLGWFVRKVSSKDEGKLFRWNKKENKLERRPNRWRVVMSLPLTPADQASLLAWIQDQQQIGLDPISLLQKAIETPVEEILPWPDEVIPPEDAGESVSAWDLVMDYFSESLDFELRPTLHQLADELTNHLKGRTLLVSHYFIEEWLPLLKPGPGWLVTLLRSRCYYNQRTEDLRNEIWIAGGYGELTSRLGYQRSKTVIEWITGKGRGSRWLKQFIQRTERVKGSDQVVALRFKVCMREPVGPEGIDVYKSASLGKGQGAIDTMERGGQYAFDTMGEGGQYAFDTIGKGGGYAIGTMEGGGSVREWDSLKDSFKEALKELKYLKDIKTTTTMRVMDRESSTAGGVVVDLTWNLSKLLLNNRIDRSVIRELIRKGEDGRAFVSWLLYGASSQGARIDNPISHAVSRLRKDPAVGAGKRFDDLANLPPEELASLIRGALRGTTRYRGNGYWKHVMDGSSFNRLRNLADQLAIEVDEVVG